MRLGGRSKLGGRRMAILVSAILALAGCEREERRTRVDPPIAAALDAIAVMPNGIGGRPPEVHAAMGTPYRSNAYQLSQGKQLYEWFGCPSCHGDGQGGSGPSLIDGWWEYGPDLVSIYSSIRDGRPHGMPSFRSRLTNDQLWQLAGYIQVLGAYSADTAAPSRSDRPQTRPAENRAPATMASY
jgi:cytochrome c oxidase cbb3-type subunit 3